MNRTDGPVTPEEEGRLSEFFETLTPPLRDEGFSANVLRRIRRRVWLRRAVTRHRHDRRRRAGIRPAIRTVRPGVQGARPVIRRPGYSGHELE